MIWRHFSGGFDVVVDNLDPSLIMSSRPSWKDRKRRLWNLLDLENPNDGDEGHAVDTHFLRGEALQHKCEADIRSTHLRLD
jgi:hypothetical protein